MVTGPALVDALIRGLPGGVLTLDPQGRINHANPAAGRILRVAAAQLVGHMLADVHPELGVMGAPTHNARVVLSATPGRGEMILGYSSRPLGLDVGGTIIAFSDVTRDEALRRRQAHRRRLEDLGKIVAQVAHEIRNPVFAITSLSQVLRAEKVVAADAELVGIVDRILAEAGRTSRLVEDLLAFGRDLPLRPRRFDLPGEVTKWIEDMRVVPPRRRAEIDVAVELEVSPSAAIERMWTGDPEVLRRIVVNLVRNGRRSVAQRCAHDGRPGHVLVRVDHDGGPVLEVQDNGMGIDPALHETIFEAFYTSDPEGTGLGLAIVRRLAEQIGATLALDSGLGRGARFRVALPDTP